MSTGKGKAVVCGGGGFIGGHLVRALLDSGQYAVVRAVDFKPLDAWQILHPDAQNLSLDLRELRHCRAVCTDAEVVYNLAGSAAGAGFLANNKTHPMLAVVADTNLLAAAREAGAGRFLYASSVRVYDGARLSTPDALPTDDGYGWEKQFAERLCRHFHDDLGLPTRVARLHDVYGPYGAYEGGREPAPAAVCRKVVEAKLTGRHQIDIWGDGTQARPFTYVSDCVAGLRAVADADVPDPFDLGPAEPVSINHLVDLAEEIAGIKLRRNYLPDAPAPAVAARNADNTPAPRHPLRWRPSVTLRDGLEQTFRWVYNDFVAHHGTYPSARPVFHSRPIRVDSWPS